MRSVLSNPAFRRLWSAGVLSTSGSEVSRLAIVLYLVHEHRGGEAVALWIALRALPGIVAAPYIGVLIDAVSHRTLLIAADLVRAAMLFILAAQPHVLLVFVAAAVESVAGSVFGPTRQSMLPRLVDADRLDRANGVDQASNTVVLIVCPVIGAQLFLAWGLAPALLIDALSFLASAMLVARVSLPAVTEPPASVRAARVELPASWRAVSADARLSALVVFQFASLICAGLWAPLAPFFIRDVLRANDAQLGWQFSAFGIGSAFGAMMAPALIARISGGRLLVVALLVEGLHMIVYAITTHWLLSLLCISSWGVAVSVISVSLVTYVQRTVQGSLLGRVFTLIRQSEQVGLLLAMALAGTLARAASVQAVFAAAGFLYVTATLATASTRGGRQLWYGIERVRPPRQFPSPAGHSPSFARPAE
jgi:predicted MFS family arabinose efflux permease